MPSTTQLAQSSDAAAVRAAEARRCSAIGQRDHAALSETLSEDLSYVHSTGLKEHKRDYIATSIEGAPRTVERGHIEVFVYGDLALVTGDYSVRIEPEQGFPNGHGVDASGLQVWRREHGSWRLYLHQGTPKPH